VERDGAPARGRTLYLVTEPVTASRPAADLRDPDSCAYFKETPLSCWWAGSSPSPSLGSAGIPVILPSISCRTISRTSTAVAGGRARVPALEQVGVQLFFNGPESFTPDDRYLLERLRKRGLVRRAGFNSIGINPRVRGQVLAEWIVHGHPPMDLWDVDIAG